MLCSLYGEAWSLLDEYRLCQLAVEEGRYDVEVMNVAVLCHCQSHQQSGGLHTRHRRKDFLEVNAFGLDEVADDEALLVLDDGSALILLHLVYPLQSERTAC